MHIKRKTIEKFWPVPRTGTKYMAVPSHEKSNSISLIMVMRDLLGIVKTKKELKKILNEKQIMINNRIVRELNYPLMLYDSLSLPSIKKHYKIIMKGKRFGVEETTEEKAGHKAFKVVGKKLLKDNVLQINLTCGKNINSKDKFETGEFVILNNKDNKIVKKIILEKGVSVVIIAGKHVGKEGTVKEISQQGEDRIAIIKTTNGEISSNIKNVFVKE